MKEQILQFLDKGFMDLLSLIVTVIILPLLVLQIKRIKSELIKQVTESPNKYDDMLLKLVTDLISESSGIESGNIAVKEAIGNIKDKLMDKTVENMGVRVEEIAKKQALPLVEKILDSVNDKVEKISVGGDYGLATNFQVAQIIKEQKDLLKKDVNGITTAFAQANFDDKGFKEGTLGATYQKTF